MMVIFVVQLDNKSLMTFNANSFVECIAADNRLDFEIERCTLQAQGMTTALSKEHHPVSRQAREMVVGLINLHKKVTSTPSFERAVC